MEQQTKTLSVSVSDLSELGMTALRACGVGESDARLTVEVLVTTDTFGVLTHGMKMLRGYVRRLRAGGLKADARPQVDREGPAWAIVDGQCALGMVTSVFAMNKAIEKAKAAGIGYAGVCNSCHFGAAGYYAVLAAKADMIGMAMANDYPSMVIPGAKKSVLGTNPFAYAVPAGQCDPIFLDIASSTVAGSKVRIAQAKKQKVPETWMVDTDGIPATDPFLYPDSAFLLPFAGHKGYGIALMIEHLAGVLAGTRAMFDVGNWIEGRQDVPTHHGAAFLAFNVAAITSLDAFKNRVDRLIRDIHETPKAKGTERLYVPGEMEWQHRRAALTDGIALTPDVVESLRGLAGDLGLNVDWLCRS